MTKALLFSTLLLASAAAAEQIVPVSRPVDLRLRNTSALDAAIVTVEYDTDGHTAALPDALHLAPGQELVLADIVRSAFGGSAESHGEIRVHAPDSVDVTWRSDAAWLPGIGAAEIGSSAAGRRRRAVCFGCRVDPPTLVRVGDFATFSGAYGVSGTATIIAPDTIRVTSLRNAGSAPGVDLRIGLSTNSRRSFAVLRVIGRQSLQNATIDLTLPPGVTLNSFDTFTVWCYEFDVIITEGRFRRP